MKQALNALEIKNLRKDYGDFYLDNLNLAVPAGSILGLIGENGAGKTTTIKAVMDLIRPDGGEVTFYGQKLKENPVGIREDVSVVFEQMSFNKSFTAEQIEKICKGIYSSWDTDAWHDAMDYFRLPYHKPLKEFSKGMQMKLNLAVALSHGAKLLLLDEPTSGLDPVMRDEVLDLFLEFMQDENHAILLSSHITTDLEKIADYIAFIHEGTLIFCLPKDELLYSYGIIRCKKEDFEKISPEDCLAWRRQEYQCSILVKNRKEIALKYPDLVVDAPSIEEIMLFYVKGER